MTQANETAPNGQPGRVTIEAQGRTLADVTGQLEAPAPGPVYVRRDIPPAPTQAGKVIQRHGWIAVPNAEKYGYDGFMVYAWLNFPHWYAEAARGPDVAAAKKALNEIILQHNGWKDPSGEEYPQPNAELPDGALDFWDSIPDELAACLLTLTNLEAAELSFLAVEQRRTSRRR